MAARLAAAVRCQARSFSTATEFVRAPIQVFGIEGRYAHALYSAATKQGSASDIEDQLNSLQSAIDSVAGLKEYLSLPVCSKDEKKATLGGMFTDSIASQGYVRSTLLYSTRHKVILIWYLISNSLSLSGAFDSAGVDPLINNMISTMIDNKRASHISGVVGAFNTIMAAQRGEVSYYYLVGLQ